MKPQIDLVWLGSPENLPPWSLGAVWPGEPAPAAINRLTSRVLAASQADALLFWDSALGLPEAERILKAWGRPGDLWHCGLKMGLGALPGIQDFINPGWMLNLAPADDIESSSWRFSLRCCLVKTAVLRQMGLPQPEFQTLEGASLDLGFRYAALGVLPRYLPWLWPAGKPSPPPSLPLLDEMRLLYNQASMARIYLALLRAWWTGYLDWRPALAAWKVVSQSPRPVRPEPFRHEDYAGSAPLPPARVSILIPTLQRYPYLRTLLDQLRSQTVLPYEIVVVDQTPVEERDLGLARDFGDLPLKVIYLDRKGQCISRNAGLRLVQGDFVLFLDDDDEVPPGLIEGHLHNIRRFQADVSSGVADEVGAGPLPWNFSFIRASDVFPTNNTLIKLPVLKRSGLFDLAYDRLPRADGDLGARIFLSGALMVLNPEISVLHHHAPAGGLRVHKARVVTYASSRAHLGQRHLPSKSEIYLIRRYFSPRQLRENLWLRALGTFGMKGSRERRALKFILSGLLFPHTWATIKAREREAEEMFKKYPQIPRLPDTGIAEPQSRGNDGIDL